MRTYFISINILLVSDIRFSVILYLTEKGHQLLSTTLIEIYELWPHGPAFGIFTPAKHVTVNITVALRTMVLPL
jgi:hypothetical protein